PYQSCTRCCTRAKWRCARSRAAPFLGSAGGPEAAPGPRRGDLEPVQKRRVAVVGRDRQGPRQAAADEGRVDEAIAEMDVGEQPAVDVAALDPEYEPDGAAFEQMVGEVRRPRPVAL